MIVKALSDWKERHYLQKLVFTIIDSILKKKNYR